jgi:large subunit ribosomal protein L22
MEVRAVRKFLRTSEYKARLVADLVRGMDVREADNILAFTPQKTAVDVRKLIQSAVANATHNHKLSEDNLFVKAITVDKGPALKRFMPRAQGRAYQILKRTSHLTVVLDERIPGKSAKSTGKAKPKKAVKKAETASASTKTAKTTTTKKKAAPAKARAKQSTHKKDAK